jgi:hypothetical protein
MMPLHTWVDTKLIALNMPIFKPKHLCGMTCLAVLRVERSLHSPSGSTIAGLSSFISLRARPLSIRANILIFYIQTVHYY